MPTYNIVVTDESNKKTNIIITIRGGWHDDIKEIIKITKEQKALLDWLIDNDYVSAEYSFEEGSPEVTDLTTEKP